MKKLYESIPIDTWKVIADKVQKLNINDFSMGEFNENLVMLRSMLSGLDISLEILSRYPCCLGEVGLASLLQAIYSGNVFNDYKKANFYEKIHQLDELDIPSIVFRPVDFPSISEGIALIKNEDSDEIIGVKKCFTDGDFRIGYPDVPLDRRYDVTNIRDANYLLNVLIELDTNTRKSFVNHNESYAILKNFNGSFPNKETFYDLWYPGLCTYFKKLDDNRRHLILKQIFYPIDMEQISYPKKLVRTPGNYHYE